MDTLKTKAMKEEHAHQEDFVGRMIGNIKYCMYNYVCNILDGASMMYCQGVNSNVVGGNTRCSRSDVLLSQQVVDDSLACINVAMTFSANSRQFKPHTAPFPRSHMLANTKG